MVQADAFGISIGQVLRVQTAEIRVKRRQHAEAKAQQVPVKIMVPGHHQRPALPVRRRSWALLRSQMMQIVLKR